MLDVICMGSSTIDLFVKINHKFKSCEAGEKILVDGLDYETGGGGTNSAVALSRMGLKTAFLGKIGEGGQRLEGDQLLRPPSLPIFGLRHEAGLPDPRGELAAGVERLHQLDPGHPGVEVVGIVRIGGEEGLHVETLLVELEGEDLGRIIAAAVKLHQIDAR